MNTTIQNILYYSLGFTMAILVVFLFRLVEKEKLLISEGEIIELQSEEVSTTRSRAGRDYPIVKVQDQFGIIFFPLKNHPVFQKFETGETIRIIYAGNDYDQARPYSLFGFWYPVTSIIWILLAGFIWIGFLEVYLIKKQACS